MTIHFKDYYSILQISSEADAEEIKASFRRLARRYHPDLNPNNPDTAERFKQISEAYDVLSDATKRRRYDRDRRLGEVQSKTRTTTKTYTAKRKRESNPGNQDARDFFLRGMAQSKGKQYQKAVNAYSKAIELDPTFIDAYLKRCEMRYKLGDNQGVLDDCYRVIQIDRSIPKAYYYQGRARFSLGYVKAAVDSYSEAIRQEENYAQAYYYRGIAHQDLQDKILAVEDWQIAADLFRTEGNYGAYRLTKKKIGSLNKSILNIGFALSTVTDTLNNSLMTLIAYLFNPMEGLLPAFARLSPSQAMSTGLVYGVAGDLCLSGSSYLLLGTPYQLLPAGSFGILQLLSINFIPFILLSVASSLVRSINRVEGGFVRDVFLAGTSFLPLSAIALLLGFIANSQGVAVLPLLTLLIFGFSYAILTLYTNCTQIFQLSEAKAAFYAPLMIVTAVFGHYLVTTLLA